MLLTVRSLYMDAKWRTEGGESVFMELNHLPDIPSLMRTQGTLIHPPSLHFSLSWWYRAIGSTTMRKHPSVSVATEINAALVLTSHYLEFPMWHHYTEKRKRNRDMDRDNESCFPSHNRRPSSVTCDVTLGSPLFSNLMDRVCILYFYKPHRKLTKSQTITLQTQALWIRGMFSTLKEQLTKKCNSVTCTHHQVVSNLCEHETEIEHDCTTESHTRHPENNVLINRFIDIV